MKKLIILLLFPIMAQSQTVDNAVKYVMKPQIDSINAAIAAIQTTPSNVYWDTVYVVNVTRAGVLDTLTTAGVYQLTISGSATAVRVLAVSVSGATVSVRTSNPLAWSGAGALTTSVVNNRVIISTTATGIIYQRQKL